MDEKEHSSWLMDRKVMGVGSVKVNSLCIEKMKEDERKTRKFI